MAQRVDFSSNASIYDRRHGAILPPAIAEKLASLGALNPGSRILDVGAGTGRVAIALAKLDCEVVAIDPALPMLSELRSKAPASHIQIAASEGAQLPFPRAFFDGVILARILYLMSDWQVVLREAFDVLKPGGRLFHEWGNGEAGETWVQIREKARSLFQDAGIDSPFHPGAQTDAEVEDFIMKLGFIPKAELPLGPGPVTTLGEFVAQIAGGELSYTWAAPEQVQDRCLPELKQWCEETFDLEQPVPIPREIRWMIYQKPIHNAR